MFKSLKLTLLLSHTGIIILTNLIIGAIFYTGMIRSQENKAREHLEFVSEHAITTIQNYIQYKSDILHRVAEGRVFKEFSKTYRDLALASYLSKFNKEFYSLSYINEKGQEEIRVTDGEMVSDGLADYSQESFFKDAIAHPNTVLLVAEDDDLTPKEPMLKMVLAKHQYFEDRFSGVLLVKVPYAFFAESISDLPVDENTFFILDTGSGYSLIISHAAPKNRRVSLEKQTDPHVHTEKDMAHDVFFKRTTLRGTDVLSTHNHIPDLGWTILAVLPYDSLSHEIIQIRNITILIFGIMCVLASFGAYFLANSITTPLARLANATRLVISGKLTEIVNIQSRDEVGKLVQSFNSMTKSLKQTTVSRDYFNTIISSMQESLIVLDKDGHIETVNSATCQMLGFEHQELIGKNLEFVTKEDSMPANFSLSRTRASEPIKDCELIYLTKEGDEIPVLFSAAPMVNQSGIKQGIVCLAINISKRKAAEKALRQSEAKMKEIAITDELSTLLNRRGFMTMAAKQLKVAKRSQENIFLMYADVDNLKWVNDNLGHQAGDQVIRETATLLRHTFRDSDILGRLGGDEFAVLLIDASDEQNIIKRLENNIGLINTKPGRTFNLSMSTGVVRFDPNAPKSLEDLMSEADTLMYRNKQEKKEKNDLKMVPVSFFHRL